MQVLLGSWVVMAAWWVTGVAGEPGTRSPVMGDLYWCSTLCMCHSGTQDQVQCFTRSQVYQLVGFDELMVMRFERANWGLEEKTRWCNDLCLCHLANNMEFKCAEEDTLGTLLDETVGDSRWLAAKEDLAEAEEDLEVAEEDLVEANDDLMTEEAEDKEVAAEVSHKMRSEDRKRNKKQKKQKKQKQMEEERHQHEDIEMTKTTPQAMEMSEAPAPTTTMTTTTTTTPTPDVSPRAADVAEYSTGEDVELLPKQEAVAASPAVTAMQPPTRRQPFPPTAPSTLASIREVAAPEVSAVREVPVERKTVASQVSQDLDELGSAVLQIRSDVVFNQRILLVTVAVAGIAMLGVLVLAVHSCARRRQEANEEHQAGGRDAAKEDHHVTKINREEEW